MNRHQTVKELAVRIGTSPKQLYNWRAANWDDYPKPSGKRYLPEVRRSAETFRWREVRDWLAATGRWDLAKNCRIVKVNRHG